MSAASQIITQDTFDLFWDLYPRKVSKGQARISWKNALKKAPAPQILTALNAQVQAGTFDAMKDDARRRGMQEKQLIPHPSTWLCAEKWEDEIVPRERPAFRNGAMELLAREAEAGMLIDAEPGNLLR